MGKIKDLTGQVFGRLTVLSFHSLTKFKDAQWNCICSCGVSKVIRATALKSKDTVSCGCFHKDLLRETETTHGDSKSREYKIWAGMRDRCKNPSHIGYVYYGGRGITVCERWDSYETFLLDMGRSPTKLHSLDRKDNNGNYNPSNCRWATKSEQANNTRRSHMITYNGKTQNLKQWCIELGLDYRKTCARITTSKWNPEKAFTFKAVSPAQIQQPKTGAQEP